MSQEFLPRFQRTINFAYFNQRTDFYRRLCTEHGITECPVLRREGDIQKLPLMHRDDLAKYEFDQRAFMPFTHGAEFRSTGGTTGQRPLFYLRKGDYKILPRLMYAQGARRRLMLWSYHFSSVYAEWDRQCGIQTVVCDPKQLYNHVELVSLLSIDSLAGTPSILLMFGAALQSQGTLQIRHLQVEGEVCHAATKAALERMYPCAAIYSQYCVGEVGTEIGFRTPLCPDVNGTFYHANSDALYIEDVKGEALITRFEEDCIFPIIRYQTGDHLDNLRYGTCACGYEGMSFELKGRQNVDFVRVAGVEIRSEDIREVFILFAHDFEDYVQTIVRQELCGGRQVVTLDLNIVPKSTCSDPCTSATRLGQELVSKLRFSATTTMHDMIRHGIFAQPIVTLLPEISLTNKRVGIKLATD